MREESWGIIRLSKDYCIDKRFDCGNEELNSFLLEDAKDYQEKKLAVTYLAEIDKKIIGYFSLSNDRIDTLNSDKATWRRIKSTFPHAKHRKDYPAVKIGRLGVDNQYKHQNIGSQLLNFIQEMFSSQDLRSGCTFLTVDALREAVPFYLKNGFRQLNPHTETPDSPTELLYYNLARLQ